WILQTESIFVEVINEFLGPHPLSGHWLASLLTLPHGVAETSHAMCATASCADDGLSELFLNQSLQVPDLTVVALPPLVRLQVVGEGDELEGQLGLRAAGVFFVLDQVGDIEFLTFDQQWEVGLHSRLREHSEELAGVALNARADAGLQHAIRRVKELLAVADAV